MTWAFGKYERGAVKMHTMLDLRGSIPTFIHITHGKWHDSNILDVMDITQWAIYVMDKAYWLQAKQVLSKTVQNGKVL